MKYAQEKQLLTAGYDRAVAKQALDILATTNAGKELRERVASMSGPEADELWKEMLEGSKNA